MVPRRPDAYDLVGTMLRRLRIENLVLIQEAELSFAPGLNAITGETGAGKTILAQAIGLLLGAKGDAGYIGANGTEAYVEAELDLPAGLLDEDDLSALAAARRRNEALQQGAAVADARLAELRALVEDTAGLEPDEEEGLRGDRERLRHVNELADGAAGAAEALAPDEGEGAAGLVGSAERTLAPLERLAPELARAGDELRDVELRLRETASELRGFLTALEAEPGRLEQIEAGLDRIAETKRRFRAQSYDELLARAAEAKAELDAIEDGFDPAVAAAEALAAAERNAHRLAG